MDCENFLKKNNSYLFLKNSKGNNCHKLWKNHFFDDINAAKKVMKLYFR